MKNTKVNYFGFGEEEYFNAVHEMPNTWMRSVPAWVAVWKALKNARHLAKFYVQRGQHGLAIHYLHEIWHIQDRNSVKGRLFI